MRSKLALSFVTLMLAVSHVQANDGRSSLAIVSFPNMSSSMTSENAGRITDAAAEAVERGIDAQRINVLHAASACVVDEVIKSGKSSDEDLLTAARKCSRGTDSSGAKIPKIDFIAIFVVRAEVYDDKEKGAKFPLFALIDKSYAVDTGSRVVNASRAAIGSAPFPEKCDDNCIVNILARDVLLLAEDQGRKLSEDIVQWLSSPVSAK